MEGEKKKRGRKPKNPETFRKETIREIETEINETGNYLYLNSDYRIKVCSLNFDLEKKTRNDENVERWVCVGHYGSLHQVCEELIVENIKDEVGKMKDIIKVYNNLLKVLLKYPDIVYVVGELKNINNTNSLNKFVPEIN